MNDLDSLSSASVDGGTAEQLGYDFDGGYGGTGRAAIYCKDNINCNLPSGFVGYVDYFDAENIFIDDFDSGTFDMDPSDGSGWSGKGCYIPNTHIITLSSILILVGIA